MPPLRISSYLFNCFITRDIQEWTKNKAKEPLVYSRNSSFHRYRIRNLLCLAVKDLSILIVFISINKIHYDTEDQTIFCIVLAITTHIVACIEIHTSTKGNLFIKMRSRCYRSFWTRKDSH